MLGTILNVMVILLYPPQLQEEQKDPYVLDQDNNIVHESLESNFVITSFPLLKFALEGMFDMWLVP